jgi:hypothetical protein
MQTPEEAFDDLAAERSELERLQELANHHEQLHQMARRDVTELEREREQLQRRLTTAERAGNNAERAGTEATQATIDSHQTKRVPE